MFPVLLSILLSVRGKSEYLPTLREGESDRTPELCQKEVIIETPLKC